MRMLLELQDANGSFGDHYSFVTRCDPLGPLVSASCRDPHGVDRRSIQRDLVDEAIALFSGRADALD